MKITRSFSIVLLSILVISCVEEVPVDNDRFIKVFGKESGSYGSAIHEFPNGNLLLGAKIDVPAFDFTNVAGVYAIGKVVEGSIALIKADKNGMQTNLSLMPIASHETVPSLEFTDLSGRAIISQVLPTSDGGFMVLGQWRGMGVSVYMPNDTLNLDESANITCWQHLADNCPT